MPEETTTEEPLPFPFASLDDLKKRWRDMPADLEGEAETSLEDASQFILDIAPAAKYAHVNTRRRIVCAVVKRSMQVPEDMLGMESNNMQAGPYMSQRRAVNPHGDFYLTKLEKQALGVGKQRAGEIDMLAGSRRIHEEYNDAR